MSGDGFVSHDESYCCPCQPFKDCHREKALLVCRRANPPEAQLRAQTEDLGSRHAFSPGCGEEGHDNLRRATSERACGTPHRPGVKTLWLEISRGGLRPGFLGKEPPAH